MVWCLHAPSPLTKPACFLWLITGTLMNVFLPFLLSPLPFHVGKGDSTLRPRPKYGDGAWPELGHKERELLRKITLTLILSKSCLMFNGFIPVDSSPRLPSSGAIFQPKYQRKLKFSFQMFIEMLGRNSQHIHSSILHN